jgi:hypothetical protein
MLDLCQTVEFPLNLVSDYALEELEIGHGIKWM